MRISKIVNGLKAFCHRDEGDMKPCDIEACIEQSLELCHNTLKYHVKVEKTLGLINMDDSYPLRRTNKIRQLREKASYQREAAHQVLDAGLVAQVAQSNRTISKATSR